MGFDDKFDIIQAGDESGNGLIIKLTLSSGRDIYGMATKNSYSGEWDLGPTWNYYIDGEKPFIFDAGRRGMGKKLLAMAEQAGINNGSLSYILLSHGHEDHDGGLYEIASTKGITAMAHEIYGYLNRTYPDKAPSPEKRDFVASCWRCDMPDAFVQDNCVEYLKEKRKLEIEGLNSKEQYLQSGISVLHTPGHSPDAIALVIDEEVILVGDTILPDITPHPTQEKFFEMTKDIFPKKYSQPEQIYGLRSYIKSLKKLGDIGKSLGEVLVLPGHRLFFNNRWNFVDLEHRVGELINHHIDRCGAIMTILEEGPKNLEKISREHFETKLLDGNGIKMAANEILSHCELLQLGNDVIFRGDGKIESADGGHFESLINDIQ